MKTSLDRVVEYNIVYIPLFKSSTSMWSINDIRVFPDFITSAVKEAFPNTDATTLHSPQGTTT